MRLPRLNLILLLLLFSVSIQYQLLLYPFSTSTATTATNWHWIGMIRCLLASVPTNILCNNNNKCHYNKLNLISNWISTTICTRTTTSLLRNLSRSTIFVSAFASTTTTSTTTSRIVITSATSSLTRTNYRYGNTKNSLLSTVFSTSKDDNTNTAEDDEDESKSNNNNNNNNNNFFYVNGEEGGEFEQYQKQQQQQQQQQQQLRPRTGWNHNLPSTVSDFWQSDSDSKVNNTNKKKTTKGQQSQQTPLKTGWLHNQQPANIVQKQQKQQTRTVTTSSTTTSTSTTISGTPVARLRLQQAMEIQTINHRIIHPPTFHTSSLGKRGIVVTEHMISVPLYRQSVTTTGEAAAVVSGTNNKRIDIYFSIVEPINTDEDYKFFQSLQTTTTLISLQQRATMYVQYMKLDTADTMVLYLQGGPGFGSPTPISGLSFSSSTSSWAATALGTGLGYQRIVLMDQRGTGKSSPITKQTLQIQFPNLFLLDSIGTRTTPTTTTTDDGTQQQLSDFTTTHPNETKLVTDAVMDVTDYLSQFRADNIVWDAEDIKYALLMKPNLDTPEGIEQASAIATTPPTPPKPWGCSLGQSYGGFCSMTYLSKVQYPPKIMLLTGGIAPMLSTDIMDLYTKFCQRVRQRNILYYQMYPGDIIAVHRIVQKLLLVPSSNVILPSGGILTARRFLQIGMMLGSSPSSFTSLHTIISNAFVHVPGTTSIHDVPIEQVQFRRTFLKDIDSISSFDDAPIYFWMHESIYADGKGNGGDGGNNNNPTNWGAHRAWEQKCNTEASVYDYRITSKNASIDTPTLFFGEMVFPWMVEDYAELSGIGLTAVAKSLANKSDWTSLYNNEQIKQTLQSGKTKIAAAVYYDDMYVDFDECMKVTSQTNNGPLALCKVYITNEYQHSGLRDDGAAIFTKLHGMASGTIRTPS